MRSITTGGRLVLAAAALTLAGCDSGAADDSDFTLATTAGAEATLSSDSVRAGARFRTHLNGENEVPGPGDDDGTGTARITINLGLQRVCYDINVADIETPTAAHVHVGAPDVAGPVVIPLPVGEPEPDHFSGCTEDVERELLRAILRDPADYYVNVHNAPFPGGAVRGQLGHQRGR